MLTIDEIIKKLNLKPHPKEGGYFYETYRSENNIPQEVLPDRYSASRCYSTCIYFMLTATNYSEMHKISSDEIFHFYLGDPVEMLHLYPDGEQKKIILGNDLLAGNQLQVIVPKDVWQGTRIVPGGNFALMGTTVAPGFEYEDYFSGNRNDLIEKYPQSRELIQKLTRQ